MNIKKYLQQQAEKDAESLITESDRQFCMELAQKAQQTAPKRKRFKFKVISSVTATCLAVALVLGITWPLALKKQPAVNEIHYKEENVAQTACTIEDVNNNSDYFKIEGSEDKTLLLMSNYDSVTGDKLYYSLDVTAGISKFTLYIVINENYNFSFEMNGDVIHKALSQYSVEYSMKSVGGVMSTELIYKGIIKVESETVYIDYTQSFEIGDEAFFGDIQSVLKLKN